MSAIPTQPSAAFTLALDNEVNMGTPQAVVDAAVVKAYTPKPTTNPGFAFGFNGTLTGAINDTSATVSEFLADAGAFGGTAYIRVWTIWDLTKKVPQAGNPIYSMALQYAAAGVKVIAILNLQNCPGKLAPTAAQTAAYLADHPTPAETGIWAYELGNELDSTAYCGDNQLNVGNWIKGMSPTLRKLGFKVIGPNTIGGFSNLYDTYLRNGVMPFLDYAGKHPSDGTAAQSLADVDGVASWLAINAPNVQPAYTEVNLHPASMAVEQAQLPLVWEGCKIRKGLFLHFPLYVCDTTAGPYAPYAKPGIQNPPVYAALKSALA